MKKKVPAYHNGTFGYEEYDEDDTLLGYIAYGRDFDLLSIRQNIDTGVYYLTLGFSYMGQYNEITKPRDEVYDMHKLRTYAGKGLDVNSNNIRCALSVLSLKEQTYINQGQAMEYCHDNLGWKWCERMTEGGEKSVQLFFGGEGNTDIESMYNPEGFDVKPKGKYRDWIDFVQGNVVGDAGFEFMVSTAFAAILLGYLKDSIQCENILVHLVGHSSTGKTSALQLATSVFGNPEIGTNTLISTWNSTMNSLLKRLLSVNGYLLGIDELSMADKEDMTHIVYKVSAGVDKDRLTRDATMKERKSGTYIVVSTGEASLLAKCNKNIGLRVRVLEFVDRKWTVSAKQSEYIKNFVTKNHGTAGVRFAARLVKYVDKYGKERVLDIYEKMRDLYCSNCQDNVRKERMSARYGLILLGAYMAKKLMKLEFDVERICRFIIENENTSEDTVSNEYDGFYDKLMSWVMANSGKFIRKGRINNSTTEKYGRIESVKGGLHELPDGKSAKNEVCIRVAYFPKIIHSMGFEDERVLLVWLKEKGYLDFESDRFTRRRKLVSVPELVYVIYIAEGAEDDEGYAEEEEE